MGIPFYVFTFDLSRQTTLILEGDIVKGCSVIKYTFYKTTYFKGKMTRTKVYFVNKEIRTALKHIRNYQNLLAKSQK